MSSTTSPRLIKSAHRVLEIIEYFDNVRRDATVVDMARTLNYPQSSTSELLRCLTQLGYLRYDRTSRSYSPTARVALMGAWATPSLFRGGPMLAAIDNVVKKTNQTVILSASSNYVLRYLHAVRGNDENAVDARSGYEVPVLRSAQGRLLLASYRNVHVRSAVHRLNAEEQDARQHVRIGDILSEFAELRERGWIIEPNRDGVGSVSVMLRLTRQMDRLALSVLAKPKFIEQQGQEVLQVLLGQRELIEKSDQANSGNIPYVPATSRTIKIQSYRRYFA